MTVSGAPSAPANGLDDFDAWSAYYQHQNNANAADVTFGEEHPHRAYQLHHTAIPRSHLQQNIIMARSPTKQATQPIHDHLQARLSQQQQRRYGALVSAGAARSIKHELVSLGSRSSSAEMPKTSMEIFMTHIRPLPDGSVDASGIMSRECFDEWEASRKSKLKNPHLTFVHTVRSHVTGDPKTGRNPFPENVEASLLKLFRRRQIWPCFRGTRVKYGIRGMFVTGFHEARSLKNQAASGSSPVTSSPSRLCQVRAIKLEPITVKPLVPQKQRIVQRSQYYQHRVNQAQLQARLSTRPRSLIGQDSIDTDATSLGEPNMPSFAAHTDDAGSDPARLSERSASDGRETASDDDAATCTLFSPDEYFEEVLELLAQDYSLPRTANGKRGPEWDIDIGDMKKFKFVCTPTAASS